MTALFTNNASTTLASGLTSGATSILVATGTGAEFPSPGVNQFFAVTLNDAATGQVYEVCYCTARTTDTLTVTRGQEGTTARAWLLGDFIYGAVTAAELLRFESQRILLAANLNIYVATTGSDTANTGLSSGSPFLTIQHAVNVAFESYDTQGYNITVNVANGTYGATVIVNGLLVGNGAFILNGNTGSPGSVILTSSTDSTLRIGAGAQITVQGFEITNTSSGTGTGGNGISAGGTAYCAVNNCIVGSCTIAQFTSQTGAELTLGSGITIVGGSTSFSFLDVRSNGILAANGVTVTLTVATNTTYSGAFANAQTLGNIQAVGSTFPGSNVIGIRYGASLNAIINTSGGGANYFSGNSAGSTSTGGQYV